MQYTLCLLATWERWNVDHGHACGAAIVHERMRIAHDPRAPRLAPRSHPPAKAGGTCSALRDPCRPISGHFQLACRANRPSYWHGRRVETDSELDRHHPKSLMKHPG